MTAELKETLIIPNHPVKSNNSVYTAKYSIVTFLFIFLYEQLLFRYANLFFLVTGIIQTFRDITPTSQYGTLLPLLFVLFLTAIKELFQDSKRHLTDRRVNSTKTTTLNGTLPWKDLKVGHVVKISNLEYFPGF